MDQTILLRQGLLKIPCILSQPEDGNVRRVVLGVHGLGGSAMDPIQKAISEEMDLFYGATLRFDFPAHGLSPLDSDSFTLQNCMDSLLIAAGYAKEQYPQVEDLCIFATGFGAYITLLAMGGISEEVLRALGEVTFRTERPLTVSYGFYQDMKSHIALNGYRQPFLILQGEEDAYIPMSSIQHLRRINDCAKLVVLPGISHRFQEEGAWDMVLDLTRDWFEYEQVLVTDWE